MEPLFVLSIVACVALLYLPGSFLLGAFGFDALRSVLLAPVGSAATYCILSIVYSKLDISCTWLNVAVIPCIVFFMACTLRFLQARRSSKENEREAPMYGWLTLALYALIGIVVGIYAYAIPLGSPENFLQGFDNAFHTTVVGAFSDSGDWSILDVSKYMTEDDASVMPLPNAGFYPALWHLLCALLMGTTGCSVPIAINAVNFVLASLLFPTSMMLFTSVVFPERRTVRFGALCAPAFVGFPWMLLYWGPLYPNALAFDFAPLAAGLFIIGVNQLARGAFKARVLLTFLLATFVLVAAQTSAVFLCILLLTPFCVFRLWTHEKPLRIGSLDISFKVLTILFLAFVVGVWSAFVLAPFMNNMVFGFNWPAVLTPADGVLAFLQLKIGWIPAQELLAVVVLIGIVSTIRHREHLWISVSYVLFGAIFVLCATSEGFLKHYLGGVWYTDIYRIFACLVIAGMPLAAQGLSSIYEFLLKRLKSHMTLCRVVMGVLLAVFCAVVYRPGFWFNGTYVDSAFSAIRWEYEQGNDPNRNALYDEEEQRFVEKVVEAIPEGTLVANLPDDGSVYAYPISGLRTYYRDFRDYEGGYFTESQNIFETPESKFIRKRANQIAEEEDVRAAFDSLGIEYVLILDQEDTIRDQPVVGTYDEDLWTGLLSITDETPGFSVVMSEGGMRLYKVEG